MDKDRLFKLLGIKFLLSAAVVLFIIAVSAIKYTGGDVNYANSDAVWHTLLTIECYNETPGDVHKFLPIVSMGKESDKGISWGSTVCDDEGNYYYTSFSPAGYFLPYLFLKAFSLPVAESSLFVFNTVLLCLSTLILMKLISSIYREGKSAKILPFIAAFIYVTFPEILHGMGMTYWHQSVMQVTLILQIYMYMKRREAGVYRYLFYALCLINPYIEWSGYVANVGFAIAEFFTNGNKKAGVKNGIFIGLITLASFNLFCAHYMSVVYSGDFFSALRGRFIARNFSVPIPISLLFQGYLWSFGRHLFKALIIMIIAVTVLCRGGKWVRDSVVVRHADILFVSLFPILENFLMKEHAVNYSYDRMKLALPICIVFCDLCYLAMKNVGKKAVVNAGVIVLAVYIGVVNVEHYKGGGYIWTADYRSSNIEMRDYIEQKYGGNAVYGFDAAVRGYVNLLYRRGIYEGKDLKGIMELTAEKDCRYGVLLLNSFDNPTSAWSMNEISNALIYDRYTDRCSYVYVYNGQVNEKENFQFDSDTQVGDLQ